MKFKKFFEQDDSNRIIFKDDNSRDFLFNNLKKKYGSWKILMNKHELYKSRLERFRSGEISIPIEIFKKFIKDIKTENQNDILSNVEIIKNNWGQIKGGKTTSKRHPELFEKGRKLGSERRRARIPIKLNLDKNICEFIGAFIGDGFSNKYRNVYVTQFSGDKRLDQEYYKKTIIPIIKKINKDLKPIIRIYNNTLRVTIYSKELHMLLKERFNLGGSKKTYTSRIPDEIIDSHDFNIINSCLRGVFDTDGSIYFDRRYNPPYIRIGLNMANKILVYDIHEILLRQGIKSTITKDLTKLQINGPKNCKLFVRKIGFSNPRHLKKVERLF